MIIVLAQLTCEACGGESWSTVPVEVLLGPVECACCGGMSATAKSGIGLHSLSGSELEYDWYEHFPEALNETRPCL